MYCQYCEKEIPENSEFCPYCGKKINENIKNKATEQEESKDEKIKQDEKKAIKISLKTVVIITCAIIALLVIIVFTANKYFRVPGRIVINNSSQNTSKIYKEYKSIIEQYNKETNNYTYMTVEYAIVDINNDNIKELVILSGTCNADFVFTFYTFKNEKAVKIGENGCGASNLYKMNNENFLKQIYISGGSEIVWDIYYDNDKFEVKEVSSRALTVEEELNKDFTKGDELIKLYEGTSLKALDSLK